MLLSDTEFLEWVANRLVHVYGESPNVDFVNKLRSMAAERRSPFRPPARTGLHRLTETVIEDDLETVTLVCACREGYSTIEGWNHHVQDPNT